MATTDDPTIRTSVIVTGVIQMTERRYFYGIWFVGDGETGDWLCQLYKTDVWIVEFRFRYYTDTENDGAFNGDEKNWYTVTTKDGSDATLERLRRGQTEVVIPVVEKQYKSKVDFVLLECYNDDPKFMFELGSREWAHMKLMPQEKSNETV